MNERALPLLFFAVLGLLAPEAASAGPETRRQSFNDGWTFTLGDVPGAERPDFDASRWSGVRLPHDWAIDGPFDPGLSPQTAALPVAGVGWYRKRFTLPGPVEASHAPHYFSVEFDGAMANSRVWLNGHELGGRPNGYLGFGLELDTYLSAPGTPNVLAVRLAPEPDSSRWYPGAGIYRNVWLEATGAVHVARHGTHVTTPTVGASSASVRLQITLRNRLAKAARITLRMTILDAEGRAVARRELPAILASQRETAWTATLQLRHPQRWDIERPYLYTLQSELLRGSAVLDSYRTPFGVRTIAFSRERGFELNGHRLKLQGVCLHHDLGALGTAVSRRAIERQLQIMKSAGVNAIRTSHNPPSPELLEAADRLGMLVIDEAFDMWRIPKVANGYSKFFDAWSERDVREMVQRDRNHPSIIMWSIGNEVPEQGQADGWQVARRLTALFHAEDPGRPTTAAFDQWDQAIRNRLADAVDIPGFNYQPTHYAQILREHPAWIIYGSETASCVSSRGIYHLPLQNYGKHASLQISSYDVVAPYWAYCPDVEFAAQQANPAVLGEFVWTGFDYLGEPTPYYGWQDDNSHDWPARSSYFGMVDLAGFPKDRYYLYQSVWTSRPMVHLLPHWNWPGQEGREIPVMVYSNADQVELLLNGRSLGRKTVRGDPAEIPVGANINESHRFSSRFRLLWQVPYQPGALQAIAFRAGVEVARDVQRTAGVPARLTLTADRDRISADGDDLSFVTVRVEDQDGNLCPLSDLPIQFDVSGAGELIAVDNGNAATTESFHAHQRRAFGGMALLIVRSRAGAAGVIDIDARAQGLAPAQLHLQSQ